MGLGLRGAGGPHVRAFISRTEEDARLLLHRRLLDHWARHLIGYRRDDRDRPIAVAHHPVELRSIDLSRAQMLVQAPAAMYVHNLRCRTSGCRDPSHTCIAFDCRERVERRSLYHLPATAQLLQDTAKLRQMPVRTTHNIRAEKPSQCRPIFLSACGSWFFASRCCSDQGTVVFANC